MDICELQTFFWTENNDCNDCIIDANLHLIQWVIITDNEMLIMLFGISSSHGANKNIFRPNE